MPFWIFPSQADIKKDFDYSKSTIKYELKPNLNWKGKKYIKGNLFNTFHNSEETYDYFNPYDFNEMPKNDYPSLNKLIDNLVLNNVDIPNYELSYYNKQFNVFVSQTKYTNNNSESESFKINNKQRSLFAKIKENFVTKSEIEQILKDDYPSITLPESYNIEKVYGAHKIDPSVKLSGFNESFDTATYYYFNNSFYSKQESDTINLIFKKNANKKMRIKKIILSPILEVPDNGPSELSIEFSNIIINGQKIEKNKIEKN